MFSEGCQRLKMNSEKVYLHYLLALDFCYLMCVNQRNVYGVYIQPRLKSEKMSQILLHNRIGLVARRRAICGMYRATELQKSSDCML